MVAKRIVPWFGGVPAVWILCLAFYQTALFVGYAYAHCLIRFVRPARQVFVHAVAFAAALLALPVLPDERWRPAGSVEPSAAILAMLCAHVAPPFVALAATGPLVQAWFARRYPSRSPYPLYAVSNLGSFLALVAYPFLLEPRLALSRADALWSLAFVATAPAVLACAALARRGAADLPSPAALAGESPTPLRVALWLLLPGCAVVILMGATSALTLDAASVPFLWMLPLGAYLTTFVLCFGREQPRRRLPWLLVAAAPLAAQRLLGVSEAGAAARLAASVQAQIAGQVLVLFGAEHGEEGLERKRRMLDDKNADLVVYNDVSRGDVGFDAPDNEVVLLVRGSERVGRGDLSALVPVAASDEIGQLTETFNQTVVRLRGQVQSEAERDEERRKREELQRNIARFLDTMTKIAQGDLTRRGQVTSDVLGGVVELIGDVRQLVAGHREFSDVALEADR